MVKIAAIIPARMASTRFPGKPLANICGLPMIEHVRRRVELCKRLDYVLLATCDEEIHSAVKDYGGNVCMTSDKHERCTDRIAEAAKDLDVDIVINIQGDEPMIVPDMIEQLIDIYDDNQTYPCANLISPITNKTEFEDPNIVKTVIDREGFVLYFSREPIPSMKKYSGKFDMYKQLGMIAFTKDFLITYTNLEPTPLEKIESVDMLRILEHGYKIKTGITNYISHGVDTVEDLKNVEAKMQKDPLCKEYVPDFTE
jgi:3-deoxy-manno-octulosonate cytidylyltransferase (CMP-KDO synthetase)